MKKKCTSKDKRKGMDMDHEAMVKKVGPKKHKAMMRKMSGRGR